MTSCLCHFLTLIRRIDDSILAAALACIPKRSIFLLEDIDCAFSRTEDLSNNFNGLPFGMYGAPPKCNVTLSGLLNILDGVASQEGILFFATVRPRSTFTTSALIGGQTNHIEDLDNALIRPGRIDRKVQYHHAAKSQATALYKRFFPISHCIPESAKEGISDDEKSSLINSLADDFANQIPEKTFTTAELQGYLLTCKFKPEKAVNDAKEWADNTMKEKKEMEEKKKAKVEKAQEKRDKEEVEKLQSTLKKMNGIGAKLDDSKERAKGDEEGKNSSPSERPSSATSSRSRSPGSGQESDTDSWTITESQNGERL